MKKMFKAFGRGFKRAVKNPGFWLGYDLLFIAWFTGIAFVDAYKGKVAFVVVDGLMVVWFVFLAVWNVRLMIREEINK